MQKSNLTIQTIPRSVNLIFVEVIFGAETLVKGVGGKLSFEGKRGGWVGYGGSITNINRQLFVMWDRHDVCQKKRIFLKNNKTGLWQKKHDNG